MTKPAPWVRVVQLVIRSFADNRVRSMASPHTLLFLLSLSNSPLAATFYCTVPRQCQQRNSHSHGLTRQYKMSNDGFSHNSNHEILSSSRLKRPRGLVILLLHSMEALRWSFKLNFSVITAPFVHVNPHHRIDPSRRHIVAQYLQSSTLSWSLNSSRRFSR